LDFARVCRRNDFINGLSVTASNASNDAARCTTKKLTSVGVVSDGAAIVVWQVAWPSAAIHDTALRIQQILEQLGIAAIEAGGAEAVSAVISNPDTSVSDALFPTTGTTAYYAGHLSAAPLQYLRRLAIDIEVKVHLDFAFLERNVVTGEVIDIATLAALGRLGHEVSSSADLVGTCASILIGLAAKGGRGEGSQEKGSGKLHLC